MDLSGENGTSISVQRCDLAPPYHCPHCQNVLKPAKFHDGEPVGFEEESAADHAFNVSLLFGVCQHCDCPIRALEICQASKAIDGFVLAVDNCQKRENQCSYIVSGSPYEWDIIRERGVTELHFTSLDPAAMPSSHCSDEKFDWLDRHTIGPAAFSENEDEFERAREIFYELRPVIYALRLDEAG